MVYFGFQVWGEASAPNGQVDTEPFGGTTRNERDDHLAKVHLSFEAPPELKHELRFKKAVRLSLVPRGVFVGTEFVPTEKVRAFVDRRVLSREIDYVVLFPARDSKWGDIFPVLEECRRSKVRIVMLNKYES